MPLHEETLANNRGIQSNTQWMSANTCTQIESRQCILLFFTLESKCFEMTVFGAFMTFLHTVIRISRLVHLILHILRTIKKKEELRA